MTPPDDPTPTLPDDSARQPLPGEPGYPTGSAEAPAIETAAPAPGKLKQRVIPDPPEMDQAKGRRAFFFVLVLVLVTALVLGAVLALNVVADPYGSVGTHLFPTVTTSDRTVKADRIEALKEPPELVVLGSSRSMRYEPSYLEKKTGLRTFNAGVNGIGGTADAWAMTQFIHEVWPERTPPTCGWSTWRASCRSRCRRAPPTSRASPSTSARPPPARARVELAKAIWQNRTTLFSLDTAKDSARLLLYRDKAKNTQSKYQKQILADGVLKQRLWSKKEWSRRYPNSVQRYSDLYKNVYSQIDPASQAYFEKTLAFMNEQGITPLLVLTPINPKLAKVLDPLGRKSPPRAGRLVHRVDAGQVRLQVPRPHRPVAVRLRPQAVLRRHAHDDDQHAEGDRLHPRGDRRGAAGEAAGGRRVGPAACSSTATRSC